MANYSLQRTNMVESQVRPSDITDRRITRAMLAVPREMFVPASMRPLAYMDGALRVSSGDSGSSTGPRYILPPRTFAKLIQLANIEAGDVVLDVGCATGYSTAVLARMAQTVVGLEQQKELADRAGKTMSDLEIDNAVVVHGTLTDGVAKEGPYDAIILEGAVETIPEGLMAQLKVGGRLVAILQSSGSARATAWFKTDTKTDTRAAFDASAALLPGFSKPVAFAL